MNLTLYGCYFVPTMWLFRISQILIMYWIKIISDNNLNIIEICHKYTMLVEMFEIWAQDTYWLSAMTFYGQVYCCIKKKDI